MSKRAKGVLIAIIVLFCVVDICTQVIVWLEYDFPFPTTTVVITDQDTYIAEKVREIFDIDYNMERISYRQGFPDGYHLEIYDSNGELHKEFRDVIHMDEVDTYFREHADMSVSDRVLIVQLIIEATVIGIYVWFFRKRRDEKEPGNAICKSESNGR